MDALRLSLIIIGVVIVVGIYLWSRRTSTTARPDKVSPALQPEVAEADLQTIGQIVPDREVVVTDDMAPEKPVAAAEVLFATVAGEQLILSLTVMGRYGRRFTGEAILQAMQTNGFVHGEMRIFHFYTENNKRAPLMSVANILEPGVFDLDKMRTFDTPGLVVFMKLPGPLAPREAFEQLLTHSKALADTLEGDLCDESRSVMNQQTIGYLLEKVEAFRFKQKMAELGAKHN